MTTTGRRARFTAGALALLILAGCASLWQQAPPVLNGPEWTLHAPEGWMRLSTSEYQMLSHDGPYLQYILILEHPLDQPFQFTRRKLAADMLPHEAAELIIDNFRADPNLRGFQLIENQPVEIGGEQAFKLVFSYVDGDGLPIQSVYYGLLLPDRLLNLRYTAAQRHYFPKYIGIFETMVQSLHLHPAV